MGELTAEQKAAIKAISNLRVRAPAEVPYEPLPPASHSCRVSVQLILDESQSISPENWRLQVEATADAVIANLDKIKRARGGGVAFYVGSFDNTIQQRMPWFVVHDEASANKFKSILLATGPKHGASATRTGPASLQFAEAFNETPCKKSHDIQDISTDGAANGTTPELAMQLARASAMAHDRTINAIGVSHHTLTLDQIKQQLDENLITKDNGGFVIIADWEGYRAAISKKIGDELARVIETIERADLKDGQWVAPTHIPASHQNGTAEPAKVLPIRF